MVHRTPGNVPVTTGYGASADTITTTGDSSDGILAQAIGGGGGNGGFAVGAVGSQGYDAAFAMGGTGATGGAAGSVTVSSNTQIETSGELSNGLVAQSIGGGGGNGGFSAVGAISNASRALSQSAATPA